MSEKWVNDGADKAMIYLGDLCIAEACDVSTARQIINEHNAVLEAVEIIRAFEESAWDGDPLRRKDDPLCIRARKWLKATKG